MRPRLPPLLTVVCLCGALLASWPARGQSGLVVEVDVASSLGQVRDLFGVNRRPAFTLRSPATQIDAAPLYAAFGLSQVRTHDTGMDLCTTYTDAIALNTGVTPAQAVSGCELSGTGGPPTFSWTPRSTADADLANPANYDFSGTDTALGEIASTGAAVYLRLGESYNGPNQTGDPVAWAKVATQIYRHLIGQFKPTAGVAAVDPAFVEVHNEPDGAFWRGSVGDFQTLFRETVTRVRAAAAAAGRSVRIGGPGFTHRVLQNAKVAGNTANGFIAGVGLDHLDFYSAHYYGNCASTTLASAAGFLRGLRSHVDSQGGSALPLHITEWNIGLGTQCGSTLFGEARMQSFASGMLTLMQDPAQGIAAANFYSGVPIMALFDFSTIPGTARLNPSTWAFWAHARLRGATRLGARVCQGSSCLDGHASETLPLLALAAQRNALTSIVLTNDGASAQAMTLRVKGLGGAVDATLRTPPAGSLDLPTAGTPARADETTLRPLLAGASVEQRQNLQPVAGMVELTTTVPAYRVLLVELRPAASTTARADCVLDWGERAYAGVLRPALQASVSAGDLHYRHYPTSAIYVGISVSQRRLLYLDERVGALQDLGALDSWAAAAGCS